MELNELKRKSERFEELAQKNYYLYQETGEPRYLAYNEKYEELSNIYFIAYQYKLEEDNAMTQLIRNYNYIINDWMNLHQNDDINIDIVKKLLSQIKSIL